MKKVYDYIILIVIIIIVIAAVLFSGYFDQKGEYIDVTAMEAKELIDTKPELVIIDVAYHGKNHIQQLFH